MKYKVAVIEDDPTILKVVTQSLESQGYMVETASEGREAVKLLDQIKPDLVILDWNLPEMNGLQICQFLRSRPSTSKVPVLMLTVYSELRHKVSAFDTGADDYLTKPFEVPELLARVNALLRRSEQTEDSMELVKLGNLELNTAKHRVTVDGREIKLRPKEFELLDMLLKSQGRVLTRQYLMERVWGYNPKLVTTRTVDSHMARLRGKLGSQMAKLIQTVPGFGYRIEQRVVSDRRKKG